MKKAYLLLPLALCACDNNKNPECIKNLTEVQVFDVIGDTDNGPAALAANCNRKMPGTDGCIGKTVLLPKGFFPHIEKDQKITPPRHNCFVKVSEYEYVRNDGKKDKVPVVEFRPDKIVLSDNDWLEILEDNWNKTYTECMHYASIEFKDTKPEDNAKACKCYTEHLWKSYDEIFSTKDNQQKMEKLSVLEKTFNTYVKQHCGKVPAKTLREMPGK